MTAAAGVLAERRPKIFIAENRGRPFGSKCDGFLQEIASHVWVLAKAD